MSRCQYGLEEEELRHILYAPYTFPLVRRDIKDGVMAAFAHLPLSYNYKRLLFRPDTHTRRAGRRDCEYNRRSFSELLVCSSFLEALQPFQQFIVKIKTIL